MAVCNRNGYIFVFLLTPLREGRHSRPILKGGNLRYFYSRPCGRGDYPQKPPKIPLWLFLLTPLREGRRMIRSYKGGGLIFLLTPLREGRLGGMARSSASLYAFLLTPLREGRRALQKSITADANFYSRPCGRGDRKGVLPSAYPYDGISTHAPAGGAT